MKAICGIEPKILIYFSGCSETRLCDVQIGDKKIFKEEFCDEEENI